MTSQSARPQTRVKVTVTFPISPRGPFHSEEPDDPTIAAVRQAAMSFFGVAEDGQHAYYLTHAGSQVTDDVTVGEVASHAKAVKFTLVKELIQG